MKHGTERNRERKRTYDSIDFKTSTGESAKVDYCSRELDVAEKWCSHCGKWVSTERMGILGFAFCPECHKSW